MRESLRTRILRWKLNWFPAYRGTGARVTHIASDFSEVRVKIPLNWRTRNLVGTMFGGSMYAAADPFFMIMLMRQLGPSYTVWDKAAAIRFRSPGRGTLFATFRLEESEVEAIRTLLLSEPSVDRHYIADLVDAEGKVHATVEKTVYIRRN